MTVSELIEELQVLQEINPIAKIEFYVNNDNNYEGYDKDKKPPLIIKEYEKIDYCNIEKYYISSGILDTSKFAIDFYLANA